MVDKGDGAEPLKKPWYELSREEVMKRLNDYQAKQRANRRRITGDDVQEMLRERRARRDQRKRERREQYGSDRAPHRDMGRAVRLGLGGVLLVSVVSVGSLAASSTDSMQAQEQINDREIALLEGDIRVLEAASWGGEDAAGLEEQLEETIEQTWQKGNEVAELQSTYQEILADLNDVELPGDGDSFEAFAPVTEHRKELIDYFDESARIIEDEDAYRAGADVPYGSDEIDVLSPWYIRYTDEHRSEYAKASSNSWELASATPQAGSPETVRVVWLNSDSNGNLLAWARGTYDAGTGVFHSLYVGQTTMGNNFADEADSRDES